MAFSLQHRFLKAEQLRSSQNQKTFLYLAMIFKMLFVQEILNNLKFRFV